MGKRTRTNKEPEQEPKQPKAKKTKVVVEADDSKKPKNKPSIPIYTLDMLKEAIKTGHIVDCPFVEWAMTEDASAALTEEVYDIFTSAAVLGASAYAGMGFIRYCRNIKRFQARILTRLMLAALEGSNINTLILSNTKEITLEDLVYLGRLKDLTSLIADNTNMTDEALLLLEGCKTLKFVSVCDCSVTAAGVAALAELRPDIQIVTEKNSCSI